MKSSMNKRLSINIIAHISMHTYPYPSKCSMKQTSYSTISPKIIWTKKHKNRNLHQVTSALLSGELLSGKRTRQKNVQDPKTRTKYEKKSRKKSRKKRAKNGQKNRDPDPNSKFKNSNGASPHSAPLVWQSTCVKSPPGRHTNGACWSILMAHGVMRH